MRSFRDGGFFLSPLDRPRTTVISEVSDRMDIAGISALLSERYGIETRVGLHCSPSSHKALGTFPTGTLRFSPGPFTTEEEIALTVDAVRIIQGRLSGEHPQGFLCSPCERARLEDSLK